MTPIPVESSTGSSFSLGEHHFSLYQARFAQSLEQIDQKLIHDLPLLQADERKALIKEVNSLMQEGATNLLQMEKEIYSSTSVVADRQKLLARLKECKSAYESKKDQFKYICITGATNAPPPPTASKRASQVQLDVGCEDFTTSEQQETCAILHHSLAISEQTNQIGAGMLLGLQAQREQIMNSRRNLGLIDSSLERSKRLLKSLRNNLLFNKYLGALFATICIVLGFLYFYYR